MKIPKPPIKYTDMAIYIDNHVYTDDCDDEKVFIYLYHLALMLAHKKKLFRRKEYYEDFAFSFAEETYMRLKSPKQEMLKDDGTPKMYKLRSILNYMKKVIYGRKVNYEQKEYSQSFSINQKLPQEIITTQYNVLNQIKYYLNDFDEVELELCLKDFCRTIKNFLKSLPYVNNEKEWNNIYISCMLTVLNSFTFSKKDSDAIRSILSNNYHGEENKLYNISLIKSKEENSRVILYHLDKSMESYIRVLCRRIITFLSDNFKVDSYAIAIDEKNLVASTVYEMENGIDQQDYYD